METEEQAGNNLSALVKNAPAVRQVLLLVGLAVSIGIGLAAAFWLRDAGYSTLYANVSDVEAAEIVSTLQTSGIDFQIDRSSGAIQVPPGMVREARMALATAGLPRGAGFGMEIIQAESGITSSQFMENARYQHALETELGRTISLLNPVQSARVHLGLPQSTVFIRDRRSRTASVSVTLYPGRTLEPSQVDGIVHIVANSIPELEARNVSVVDGNGRTLTQSGEDDDLALSERQLDYIRRLEQNMEDNIVRMLARLVGPENVQATVTAEVDFTVQEESREQYDPASAVVRSEEIQENRNNVNGTAPAGVPGALSNTPPQVGAAAAAAGANAAQNAAAAGSESVHQVRNFELDRTMSVTRRPSGSTTRLSVAVVLNEAIGGGDGDAEAAEAAEADRLAELVAEAEQLVRGAVAFNDARGDTLTVQTAPFYVPPEAPEVEAPSFFTSPTFQSWLRQGASVLAILLVGFGLARPIVRMITAPAPQNAAIAGALPAGGAAMAPMQLSYDDKVGAVRQLVDRDSERVARIVRQWVGEDG